MRYNAVCVSGTCKQAHDCGECHPVAVHCACFLGERVSRLDWTTIVVVIGGMTLFFFDRLTPGGMWGNALAIASGVSCAGLVTLLRKQKEASPSESILMGNVLTALVGLPFMFEGTPGVLVGLA